MSTNVTLSNEKLVQDIKAVVADAEAILSATANQAGEGMTELRASMLSRLTNAKDRLMEVEEAVVKKTRQAVKATDEYIHENPWQSVIISGGVGFLIGYLVSSRRD